MLEYKKDGWKAFWALLPTLLLMAVFTFYPIFRTLIAGFMEGFNFARGFGHYFANFGNTTGLGFNNFVTVFTDPMFLSALKNTMLMVFISVPISVVVALLIAVGLNSIKKLQGVFQTIFFLPYVTNTVALGLVFSFMFSSNYGLINSIIQSLGGEAVAWTAMLQTQAGNVAPTYWSSMFVLMTYTIWQGLAFKILVFLSGMQSIDKQYYQAAQIDATPRGRVFLKITIPLLSPMIAYIMITSLIGAFKAYSHVISVFNGRFGPLSEPNMLITIVGYIYEKLKILSTTNALGEAAAGSIILFAIIMLFTLVQLYVSKKKVHY